VIDAALAHVPMLLRAAEHTALPALVQRVADAAEPWKNLYGDSKVVATVVVFAHLGALLVGGGLALAADRTTMRAVRGGAPVGDAGSRSLADLAGTHRPVVIALVVMFASGVALFLSDVETFWGSAVYWIKMALVAALLVNGWLMMRAESALAADGASGRWGRLCMHAALSAALWMATLLAGVALANS
jgi:hypothetical protein